MKILWLDVETTGLNKEKCDIIQIAGIVIINGEEKERFNFHCQPINWENIEPTSFEKTGMTFEKLREFQMPQELYIKFIELLDKYIDRYNKEDKFYLAGHNVQFDLEFLKNFFIKMGNNYFGSYFYYHTIDLMAFAIILHTAGLISLRNFKLGNIADYLTIQPNGNLHDAEADIDLTRKCFCKLVAKYINFGDIIQKQEENDVKEKKE